MMLLLKGAPVSKTIRESLKEDVEELKSRGVVPKLVAFAIQPDESSLEYMRGQEKSAEKLGIAYERLILKNADLKEAKRIILELNESRDVHGIIVMRPLPGDVPEQELLALLSPRKDVEGVTLQNLGYLFHEAGGFSPCTAEAILRVADHYSVSFEGKNVVIVGRSITVGKPIAMMLLRRSRNATVTVCHTRTRDLKAHTKMADVLIVAVGRANMVGREHVKPGSVIFDVGINLTDSGVTGDVNFDEVCELVDAITPVPGGISPVTTAVLMSRVVEIAKNAG